VQNGATGAPSNGLSLNVSNSTGVAPQTSALTTTPSQPIDGQAFTFSITGTGFDPSSAMVIFTGPNCTPCSIANSALASATSTQLSGTVTLAAGNYTITVQNGSSGAPSNGQALTVAATAGTTPQIRGITTSPSVPVNAQTFTFTVSGTGFDPSTAVVIFTGPNCAPCSITNAALSTKTSTQLTGTAALVAGSYLLTVQNGSGPSSNSQQLTVSLVPGSAPHLDNSITTPASPVHGQATIFILFGSGFDPNSVMAVFTGSSCTPSVCTITNSDITVSPDASAIAGIINFPAAGTYTVTAQNGSGGAASNGLTITVQ
jgi:hypothetical protein